MSDLGYDELVKKLYLDDEYIAKNPSLHEEDSLWKVSKILPLVSSYITTVNKDEITLLDVGGGAGLILKAVSAHITKHYGINVNKYIIDLSPGMLAAQIDRNPEYSKALNEDIRNTSLGEKEIDLALIIDLLEHVPDPTKALEEIRRISDFAIFKVPLEDTLFFKSINLIKKGKPRQALIDSWGHINTYNFSRLKCEIEEHTGNVQWYYFTNACDYYSRSEYYRRRISKGSRLLYLLGANASKISPRICACVINDFVMILVRCY